MTSDEGPNDAASKGFIAKLNRFRASLSPDKRQMLDALVEGARQAHEQGDVEVYWFTSPGAAVSASVLGSYGPYSGTASYSGMRSGGV